MFSWSLSCECQSTRNTIKHKLLKTDWTSRYWFYAKRWFIHGEQLILFQREKNELEIELWSINHWRCMILTRFVYNEEVNNISCHGVVFDVSTNNGWCSPPNVSLSSHHSPYFTSAFHVLYIQSPALIPQLLNLWFKPIKGRVVRWAETKKSRRSFNIQTGGEISHQPLEFL